MKSGARLLSSKPSHSVSVDTEADRAARFTAKKPSQAKPKRNAQGKRPGRLGHSFARVGVSAPRSSSGGRPLPGNIREKMEGAFGQDFSHVQIHQDGNAEALGAHAYTQGSHIHFAQGKYNPQSHEGQKILGHELTHVIQQRQGKVALPQGKGAPINADSALEAQADRMGGRAASGRNAEKMHISDARTSRFANKERKVLSHSPGCACPTCASPTNVPGTPSTGLVDSPPIQLYGGKCDKCGVTGGHKEDCEYVTKGHPAHEHFPPPPGKPNKQRPQLPVEEGHPRVPLKRVDSRESLRRNLKKPAAQIPNKLVFVPESQPLIGRGWKQVRAGSKDGEKGYWYETNPEQKEDSTESFPGVNAQRSQIFPPSPQLLPQSTSPKTTVIRSQPVDSHERYPSKAKEPRKFYETAKDASKDASTGMTHAKEIAGQGAITGNLNKLIHGGAAKPWVSMPGAKETTQGLNVLGVLTSGTDTVLSGMKAHELHSGNAVQQELAKDMKDKVASSAVGTAISAGKTAAAIHDLATTAVPNPVSGIFQVVSGAKGTIENANKAHAHHQRKKGAKEVQDMGAAQSNPLQYGAQTIKRAQATSRNDAIADTGTSAANVLTGALKAGAFADPTGITAGVATGAQALTTVAEKGKEGYRAVRGDRKARKLKKTRKAAGGPASDRGAMDYLMTNDLRHGNAQMMMHMQQPESPADRQLAQDLMRKGYGVGDEAVEAVTQGVASLSDVESLAESRTGQSMNPKTLKQRAAQSTPGKILQPIKKLRAKKKAKRRAKKQEKDVKAIKKWQRKEGTIAIGPPENVQGQRSEHKKYEEAIGATSQHEAGMSQAEKDELWEVNSNVPVEWQPDSGIRKYREFGNTEDFRAEQLRDRSGLEESDWEAFRRLQRRDIEELRSREPPAESPAMQSGLADWFERQVTAGEDQSLAEKNELLEAELQAIVSSSKTAEQECHERFRKEHGFSHEELPARLEKAKSEVNKEIQNANEIFAPLEDYTQAQAEDRELTPSEEASIEAEYQALLPEVSESPNASQSDASSPQFAESDAHAVRHAQPASPREKTRKRKKMRNKGPA